MIAPWKPLLAGTPEEGRAWAALDSIARDLDDRRATVDALGLEAGLAGHALFAAYRARGLGDGDAAVAARLDELVERSPTSRIGASLYSGLAGVAWVLEHAGGNSQDALAGALAAWATRPDVPFDVIGGAAGVGLHVLDGLPRPETVAALRVIVTSLCDRAVPAPLGRLRWCTPADAATRARFPKGHENFGPAHGLPGVLVVIARALASGALDTALATRAVVTLRAGMMRLLDQAIDSRVDDGDVHAPGHTARPAHESSGRYPGWLAGGAPAYPARLAWCYGDAGVAASLVVIADLADRVGLAEATAWRTEATRTAASAAMRPIATAGVRDPGLCHGSAGLALLFARLHAQLGDPALADAARRWWGHALATVDPDKPLAGVRAWDGASHVIDDGWLGGAAGVGLSLLAAVTPVAPAWDRLLGASS